jgi:hypothetical protein
MNLDYVPLLRVMWDIQSVPRGQPPDFNDKKRFKKYLGMIFDYDKKVCKLPTLLAMNPMGKDHVTALLDAYLAMYADGTGAQVATEVAAWLADVPDLGAKFLPRYDIVIDYAHPTLYLLKPWGK